MNWRTWVTILVVALIVIGLAELGSMAREAHVNRTLDRRATSVTHIEKVLACNREGKLFSDGVCQRIYINMCRPAPTPCRRE